MFSMVAVTATNMERGTLIPPWWFLLLLLLLLTPPMVFFLTTRFQSWEEFEARAAGMIMTPFRSIAKTVHSHKPRHA